MLLLHAAGAAATTTAGVQIMYCNVEGIQWIDDVRFVIASDKAKSRQPFRCVNKEQRLTIFSLPDTSGHLPDDSK